MSKIQKYSPGGGAMPVVDVGDGETVSAAEFFAKVQQFAPLALQNQRWMYLARMAFVENRADALMLAKQQAQQIQRGQLGNGQAGMSYLAPQYQSQAFPSTYAHPGQYPPHHQAPPQPIVFAPQVTVNPTIAPTFANSPMQSSTSRPTQTSSHKASSEGYDTDDTHPFVIAMWVVLILLALLTLVAL